MPTATDAPADLPALSTGETLHFPRRWGVEPMRDGRWRLGLWAPSAGAVAVRGRERNRPAGRPGRLLARLGITAIEILPVGQFPGRRGRGYDGALPYAPHRDHGRWLAVGVVAKL